MNEHASNPTTEPVKVSMMYSLKIASNTRDEISISVIDGAICFSTPAPEEADHFGAYLSIPATEYARLRSAISSVASNATIDVPSTASISDVLIQSVGRGMMVGEVVVSPAVLGAFVAAFERVTGDALGINQAASVALRNRP